MGSGRGSSGEMLGRAMRTMFFMLILIGSLLLSSAPLVISIFDVTAPCVLLSSFRCCGSCFELNKDWTNYSFRSSIVDIPMLSLMRSLVIFCVYFWCGVPSLTYGPYVATTLICGFLSTAIVIVKIYALHGDRLSHYVHMKHGWEIFSVLLCSMVLALGHIVIAYKVKCQAQRKMHLYRLDPEAVIGLQTRIYEKHRWHPVEEKLLQKS